MHSSWPTYTTNSTNPKPCDTTASGVRNNSHGQPTKADSTKAESQASQVNTGTEKCHRPQPRPDPCEGFGIGPHLLRVRQWPPRGRRIPPQLHVALINRQYGANATYPATAAMRREKSVAARPLLASSTLNDPHPPSPLRYLTCVSFFKSDTPLFLLTY